jgi:hypothetical protein
VFSPHRGQVTLQLFHIRRQALHQRPALVPNDQPSFSDSMPLSPVRVEIFISAAWRSLISTAVPGLPSYLVPSRDWSPMQPGGSLTFGISRLLS